jgi:HEAT repeat protein
MIKRTIFLVGLLLNLGLIFAQSTDPVILSYQRNFIRSSIGTKLELLNDAARITTVDMTPLYIDALNFVLQNYPVLGTDSQLMDLAVIAVNKASAYNNTAILPVLRPVFTGIPDSRVRIACLDLYGVLLKGQKDEIAFLDKWFSDAVSATSPSVDVKTLAVCAGVLGKIGDSASFPVLFTVATSSLDSSIVQASITSLNSITDGYTDNILAIIAAKHIKDMYAAFSFAMKKDSLPATDRGRIAEAAFTSASDPVFTGADSDSGVQTALLRESMDQLTLLKWSQASPQVVKYFYRKQGEYKNDRVNVDSLVPVVHCMGAMGTTEAAQALSIFLGLLNSDTEQKKTYNEQLMLAVIQALGDLGDKSAFDYLLYVGYLDYPESVKKASRDALARLKW